MATTTSLGTNFFIVFDDVLVIAGRGRRLVYQFVLDEMRVGLRSLKLSEELLGVCLIRARTLAHVQMLLPSCAQLHSYSVHLVL